MSAHRATTEPNRVSRVEADVASLEVEVVWALPEQQTVITVSVDGGTTCEGTIAASGILDRHPEIDLGTTRIGIYGEICALDQPVADGDRVEIYRPLAVDPREQRRRRVQASRRR